MLKSRVAGVWAVVLVFSALVVPSAGSPVVVAAGEGCTVSGTSGDDVLVGTSGDDVICGEGGDDTIRGLGGDDRLFGGAGNDVLEGGDGDDEVWGEDGDDELIGGAGNDALFGASGRDVVSGSDGIDFLRGGGDADVLDGGDDADRVFGDDGDDDLSGSGGNDDLSGGPGKDSVAGGAGVDACRGENEDGCEQEWFGPEPGSAEMPESLPYSPVELSSDVVEPAARWAPEPVREVATVAAEVVDTALALIDVSDDETAPVGSGVVRAGVDLPIRLPIDPVPGLPGGLVDLADSVLSLAMVDEAVAGRAGFDKVAVRVEPDAAIVAALSGDITELRIGVDYSSFRWAFGGSWDERVALAWFDGCWLDAAEAGDLPDPDCAVPVALDSSNDLMAGVVTATVPVDLLAGLGGVDATEVGVPRELAGLGGSSMLLRQASGGGGGVGVVSGAPSAAG